MKIARILLIVWAVGLVAAPAWADTIPVNNAGFEAPAMPVTGFVGYIPNWTTASWLPDSVGVFHPGAGQYLGGIPEGNNVAFTKGPWISQVLTTTLQSGFIYTLMVDVGYRLDNSSGAFTGYTVALLAGNTVIASTSSGVPSPGGWITAIASYNALNSDPLAGQPLQIVLSVNQPYPYQVNFDNVRLDGLDSSAPPPLNPLTPVAPVPEPGTFALLFTGLAGIVSRKLRR